MIFLKKNTHFLEKKYIYQLLQMRSRYQENITLLQFELIPISSANSEHYFH